MRSRVQERMQPVHILRTSCVQMSYNMICSGDHVKAGVCIARACGVISTNARVLIGDAPGDKGLQWHDLKGALCELPGLDGLAGRSERFALYGE